MVSYLHSYNGDHFQYQSPQLSWDVGSDINIGSVISTDNTLDSDTDSHESFDGQLKEVTDDLNQMLHVVEELKRTSSIYSDTSELEHMIKVEPLTHSSMN